MEGTIDNTKKHSVLAWLEQHWPISTPFLALYLTIVLVLFVLNKNFALFLIWIQIPLYWLHQFEEYIYPGGFMEYFNIKVLSSNRKDWPITKKDTFWINIPITFIGFPVSAILAGLIDISIGIWTAYFSIINALSHLGMFFRGGYNPGLVASVSLNIPVGVYTIYYFATSQLISLNSHIIGVSIAIAIQVILMIWGLKFLKTKVKRSKNK
ncbi:hypothetical protein C9439_08000 [archaeon SCG-AAA382B04]|nr:hypothetical protein C9439_08000 [archaeon SCG-AAA382B04]